jgi:hypothetical protein
MIGAGVLATLTMDMGSALVRKLGFTAGVPPLWFGRWFGHIARGRLVHHTIAEAADVPGGLQLAVTCHYLIGISLTVLFWLLMRQWDSLWGSPSHIAVAALAFGMLTNVLPWLFMFPAMGLGAFGRAAPPELMLLRTSFVNHFVFGLGVAWTAIWLWRPPA